MADVDDSAAGSIVPKKKNDSRTIFIRYSPPSAALTRLHIEAISSDIGPVKKASVIKKKTTGKKDSSLVAGFAFVKFTTENDAKEAVKILHSKVIYLSLDKTGGGELVSKRNKDTGDCKVIAIELSVELASDEDRQVVQKQQQKNEGKSASHSKNETNEDKKIKDTEEDVNLSRGTQEFLLSKQKRTSRIILRNLSFYASSKDIKKTLEAAFGTVVDINLPLVPNLNSSDSKTNKQQQHRGFAFVTFANAAHAKQAVNKGVIKIKKRPVAMDYSVSKLQHDQQKQEKEAVAKDNGDQSRKAEEDDASAASSSSETECNDDTDIGSVSDGIRVESATSCNGETSSNFKHNNVAIKQNRTLFLRNLPFDCTRHDLFEIFSPFGYISSLYIVKDTKTGIPKGTAFLEYQRSDCTQKALEASGDADGQDATTIEGLKLQGRRIICHRAVDRATATSQQKLASQQHQYGRDRRNLYLKNEGRITDNEVWENDLLEGDREKRGRSHNEKSQKLRSPLFFINANRLSIRNLAKHVAKESQLRTLVVEALERGLQRNVVTKEDIWMQQKAQGEFGTSGIALEDLSLPTFSKKEIKRFIPSIYINRNDATSASKGFGFVEFTHHAHALACLRELNNNPRYSREYALGGKKMGSKFINNEGSHTKIPRLIVEFTVENKAKAKLQADRRARQLASAETQRKKRRTEGNQEGKVSAQGSKKKSRGALQRERKRKEREQLSKHDNRDIDKQRMGNTSIANSIEKNFHPAEVKKENIKAPKHKKRRVLDKEEIDFDKMVKSYKETFVGKSTSKNDENKISLYENGSVLKDRWFDA